MPKKIKKPTISIYKIKSPSRTRPLLSKTNIRIPKPQQISVRGAKIRGSKIANVKIGNVKLGKSKNVSIKI